MVNGTDERDREKPETADLAPVVDALRDTIAHDADMAFRRDRLLAWLALASGAGVVLAVPFALHAGSEFFLPVTIALVIAVALVPLLEWLERRGLPSALSALLCVLLFLGLANAAIASVIIPATEWFARLPSRILSRE